MSDRKRSRSPRRRNTNSIVSNSAKRKPVDNRIFISNLPWEAKWQDIKDLFRKEVGEVSFVQLFDDQSGRPRGAGVLEFPTAELAKDAIEKMHRLEYKGRKIVVKEDFDVDRDKYGRIITDKDRERMSAAGDRDRSISPRGGGGGGGRSRGGHGGGGHSGGGGGMVNFGNTYGLSTRFLESLGIDSDLHTRVFVANLDYDVDEKKLKEVFRLAGKVVGVELSRDKEGKSRGFAVVVFDHPVEAVQSISMLNDQQLLNRRITVRFDKVLEEEQPRSLKRLPEGLRGVGMGLGQDGVPLWDVRATLGETMNQGNTLGLGSLATSMVQQQPAAMAAAASANTSAAIQAALSTILGLAGTAQQQQQMNMGMMQAGMMGGGGMGGMMGAGGGMGGGGMGGGGMSGGGMSGGGMGGGGMSGGGMGGGGMGGGGGMAGGGMGGGGMGNGGMGGGGGMSQMDMERSMLLERNMERMSSGMDDRDMVAMGGGGSGGRMDRGMMDRGMGGGLLDRNDGMGGMRERGMGGGMMSDMDMGGMDMGMSSRGGGGGMNERSMADMSDRGDMGMPPMRSSAASGGGMSRLSDKVMVKNLPTDCTWQQLKDKFKPVGDVKFAEMKERGVGIIRFASEREAERAVLMLNGQRLENKNIIVTLF